MLHSQNLNVRRLKSGFTLIELLVVIAIVGVISSVVLASLSSARSKAANTTIKSNLNNIRGQSLVFFNDNGFQYAASSNPNSCSSPLSSVFRDARITDMLLSVNNLVSPAVAQCRVSKNAWMVRAPLKVAEGSSIYWCVDNTGVSVGITQSRYDYLTSQTTVYTCQ